MSSSIWTLQRQRRLIELWSEGRTATAVASLLGAGISRSAVLGKVHRLGLVRTAPCLPTVSSTSEKTASQKDLRRGRKAAAARASVAAQSRRPPLEPGSGRHGAAIKPTTSILSVGRGQCRWPCGTPGVPGFGLCGGPVARGAYCAAHAAVGYQARPMIAESLIRMAEAGLRRDPETEEGLV